MAKHDVLTRFEKLPRGDEVMVCSPSRMMGNTPKIHAMNRKTCALENKITESKTDLQSGGFRSGGFCHVSIILISLKRKMKENERK